MAGGAGGLALAGTVDRCGVLWCGVAWQGLGLVLIGKGWGLSEGELESEAVCSS